LLGWFAVTLTGRAHPLVRGAVMGLWFSSKQYTVLMAPVLLKSRRCRPVVWVIGVLVGLATFLPMALWNLPALWHDMFTFFTTSVTRPDALSLAGALARFGYEMPLVVSAPLCGAGIAFFTVKAGRSLAWVLFSTACTWLVFFLFGKQAFMNYWYVILFTLILAVAAIPRRAAQAPRAQ
jgi:hypothetical protein